MPSPTPLLRLYKGVTGLALPLVYRSVSKKLRAADVAETRIGERLGVATQPRPNGQLIWFHGASVGESLSVLTLISRLGERLPEAQFLMTSGTATSAELVGRRLPHRTRHQFLPLDAASAVTAFYDHWAPDAGIFVESELWPNILIQGHARGIPLALLNARMSKDSVRGWTRFPKTAKQVLDVFAIMLTQNRDVADNLRDMGADPSRVSAGINLKATSAPLPVDLTLLRDMQAALGERPIWVASSTHPGEEETVLAAHKTLLASYPELCLLLVPRHPERGSAVADLITQSGMRYARRSTGEPLDPDTSVYLADTLGETGTWYALCPIVFLGGSLEPIGGHNPFEPAQAGAAVLTGPHVTNFAETYAPLLRTGGAVEVSDASSLAQAVQRWLRDTEPLQAARDAAARYTEAQGAKLDEVIETLCTALALDDA